MYPVEMRVGTREHLACLGVRHWIIGKLKTQNLSPLEGPKHIKMLNIITKVGLRVTDMIC